MCRSVYMDRIETGGEHTRLCEHSPQLPQGFTPVGNLTFWPGQHSPRSMSPYTSRLRPWGVSP